MKDVLLGSERQVLLAPFERTPCHYDTGTPDEDKDKLFSLPECRVDWPVELNNVTPATVSAELANAADAAAVAALREAQQDPVLSVESNR